MMKPEPVLQLRDKSGSEVMKQKGLVQMTVASYFPLDVPDMGNDQGLHRCSRTVQSWAHLFPLAALERAGPIPQLDWWSWP